MRWRPARAWRTENWYTRRELRRAPAPRYRGRHGAAADQYDSKNAASWASILPPPFDFPLTKQVPNSPKSSRSGPRPSSYPRPSTAFRAVLRSGGNRRAAFAPASPHGSLCASVSQNDAVVGDARGIAGEIVLPIIVVGVIRPAAHIVP